MLPFADIEALKKWACETFPEHFSEKCYLHFSVNEYTNGLYTFRMQIENMETSYNSQQAVWETTFKEANFDVASYTWKEIEQQLRAYLCSTLTPTGKEDDSHACV